MFSVDKIRAAFPVFKHNKTIYLDNAATTYKPQVVIDAVTLYLSEQTANSGRGDYHDAYLVDTKVDETRELVCEFINASSKDEIVFTHGTTMSLNFVAQSFGKVVLKKDDEVLLSLAEHASNTLPWFKLADEIGIVVKFLPLDDKGCVTPAILEAHMSSKTKIVSIAHVSNVLGYINDIKNIAKVVHKHGAYIIVDGAQSVPHLKTDVRSLDVDFLAFSGHKMLAPTGIGVLYGKKALLEMMPPFLTGGGNNAYYDVSGKIDYFKVPQRFEAGTLNIEAIYGLNAAIKFINDIGLDAISSHEKALRAYAISRLKEMKHITLYNEDADTGIITFNVNGVFAQDAATFFNSKGIAVRSGLHCAKTLKHYIGENGTVRASIYLYNTKEEIDIFLDAARKAEDYLDAYFE